MHILCEYNENRYMSCSCQRFDFKINVSHFDQYFIVPDFSFAIIQNLPLLYLVSMSLLIPEVPVPSAMHHLTQGTKQGHPFPMDTFLVHKEKIQN